MEQGACDLSRGIILKFAWEDLEKTPDLEGLKACRPSDRITSPPTGIRKGHLSSRPISTNHYHKVEATETG